MNRNVIRTLIFSVALTAGAAHAASNSVSVQLGGELPKNCSVTAENNNSMTQLDMTSTAPQGGERITAACNYIGTLKVEVSSLNSGKLATSQNGGAQVPYTVSVPGYAGGVSLASPVTLPSWNTGLSAQSAVFNVRLANAATVAGTYADTITVKVTPN